MLCAGQLSKMGLVVARLADNGLCLRCKEPRGPLAPLVDLPGKRAVQFTVKTRWSLQLPVFRTPSLTRLRVQESRRQVGTCSPWKSSSVPRTTCGVMLLTVPRLWQESTGGFLKLRLFAFDRVQAERPMITPFFGAQCSDAFSAVFAAAAPQNSWISCPIRPGMLLPVCGRQP